MFSNNILLKKESWSWSLILKVNNTGWAKKNVPKIRSRITKIKGNSDKKLLTHYVISHCPYFQSYKKMRLTYWKSLVRKWCQMQYCEILIENGRNFCFNFVFLIFYFSFLFSFECYTNIKDSYNLTIPLWIIKLTKYHFDTISLIFFNCS